MPFSKTFPLGLNIAAFSSSSYANEIRSDPLHFLQYRHVRENQKDYDCSCLIRTYERLKTGICSPYLADHFLVYCACADKYFCKVSENVFKSNESS
jgi:hypothetical protein